MKKIIFFILMLYFVCPAAAWAGDVNAEGVDAETVIARAWDYMRGTTSVSLVHMTVHRPDWERKTTIRAWTRGRENSIFQIIAPKKDKGNGTLKIGRKMWTYNPKINRVVKIPPSMMSQSWMGSDFSNNDLSKADSILTDYDHELSGVKKVDGVNVYIIKAVPKPDAPVIWGMQTLKIREDGILVEQAFYDEDLEPVKVMGTRQIRDMGGRPFPAKWTMRKTDAESEEEYTLLEYQTLEFDVPLKANLFKIDSLKRPVR